MFYAMMYNLLELVLLNVNTSMRDIDQSELHSSSFFIFFQQILYKYYFGYYLLVYWSSFFHLFKFLFAIIYGNIFLK